MENDSFSTNYISVPRRIIKHLRLFSESDLKAYLGILDSVNEQTNKAYLTLSYLSHLVGMSLRSVNKSVLRLVALGYLEYYPSHNKEGKSFFVITKSALDEETTQEKSSLSHEKSQTFPNNHIYSIGNTTDVGNGINKTNNRKEGDVKGEKNRKQIDFIPKTKQEALAYEIADAFGDLKLLPILLFYCKKYSGWIICTAFSEAKQTPDEKIKKSKIALFIYLVHKYGKESKN